MVYTQVMQGLNPQARRILVVEDEPSSLEILQEPLRWEGYDVHGCTGEQALPHIESWHPHIILLDWLLPSASGISIVKQVKKQWPQTTCIFVSSNSSTEAIIQGLDAGADDFLAKPFVPLELLARIRTHLRLRDLHDQLMVANQKLKELVDIDDLTGLYNMRSLYQRLEWELERGRRFRRDVCVVMLDMDYFKSVNDGHDHIFGSYVLSEVGKIIKANTRNIDIPARYGGDEFLIVLTEVNQDGALHFCERLLKTIAKTTFTMGKDSINLTVSIGFAMSPLQENIEARELVRRADHALYKAKRAGRNQIQSHDEESLKKSS